MATLDASDALTFGSPTYMGGPAAQFMAFADATVERWSEQRWRDKLAAGFTVSSALTGELLGKRVAAFALNHQRANQMPAFAGTRV